MHSIIENSNEINKKNETSTNDNSIENNQNKKDDLNSNNNNTNDNESNNTEGDTNNNNNNNDNIYNNNEYDNYIINHHNIENKYSFIFSRIFSLIISMIIIFGIIYIKYKMSGNKKEDFEKFKLLKYQNFSEGNSDKKVFHKFCNADIYNIPTYLYQTFINDAYYYDEETNSSSFYFQNYRRLFFNNDYQIDVKGNLIKDNNGVKMVQYNVKNKYNKVTILSIKGTSKVKDVYLDCQLYIPSIFLNIINTYSNIDQQKEAKSFKLMEYGLSIPYRIFFQIFVVEKYLDQLKTAYYNINNTKSFEKNVVFVGHSLGGGLAKIIGKIVGRDSVSLSGPGINAFHSLWKYTGNSTYFELTSVDIIPDLDLVPRVEISGGTIYRLICLQRPYECHSKELSLCESLMMCDNPNGEEYCLNVKNMTQNDFEKLKEKSKFIN